MEIRVNSTYFWNSPLFEGSQKLVELHNKIGLITLHTHSTTNRFFLFHVSPIGNIHTFNVVIISSQSAIGL